MFSNPRIFAITIIVLYYMAAMFSVFIWALQAPVGDFWHMDGHVAGVLCASAVAMHILMYFDPSFGFRKVNYEYEEYCEYAKRNRFQPLSLDTFESLQRAGFDPRTNLWS